MEEEHRLFSFLTTKANGMVGPLNPEAMPVLLTTAEEWRAWLEAPAVATRSDTANRTSESP